VEDQVERYSDAFHLVDRASTFRQEFFKVHLLFQISLLRCQPETWRNKETPRFGGCSVLSDSDRARELEVVSPIRRKKGRQLCGKNARGVIDARGLDEAPG
jgi:hypothetical protein